MIRALLVTCFDALKKLNMERHYRNEQVWGRADKNPDAEAAVALIADRQYARCLDVGTGLGHYAELLAPLTDHILAIDISERAIERARARLAHVPNIEFRAANIRDVRNQPPFDLIVLADVLYYFGDERFPTAFSKLIADINDMLAPKGRVLITTFITRGRTRQAADSYGQLFEAAGLTPVTKTEFSIGDRTWVQQVLERP